MHTDKIKQRRSGTFEYILHNLIDNELNLSAPPEHIHNDETGVRIFQQLINIYTANSRKLYLQFY